MDALAAGNKPKMLALCDGAVEKSRKPAKRRGDRTPVGKLHDERVFSGLNGGGLEGCGIKNQSNHASAARVVGGFAQSNGKWR